MLIVAERINSTRKSIFEAVSEKNEQFIRDEAISQTKAGAHYIDVNAGQFAEKEGDYLAWLVEIVQSATDLPLCIDSPNPEVIKQALPLVKQPPMINSITLERERFESLIQVIVDNKPCKVIGLCQSDALAAHSSSEKVELAGQLIEKLTGAGIAFDDIYIDPLTFPLATDSGSAVSTLDATASIMKAFPEVHTICGLTNVSYGLPQRKLINRSFFTSAIAMGLDSAIIDPTDQKLMASMAAAELVAGRDSYAMGYIKSFRQGILDV